MSAQNKIDIPHAVRTVENKSVRHMCKADFRQVGIFKFFQEFVFRRCGKLLFRAAERKPMPHCAADAQRLTRKNNIRITVIEHRRTGFLNAIKKQLI